MSNFGLRVKSICTKSIFLKNEPIFKKGNIYNAKIQNGYVAIYGDGWKYKCKKSIALNNFRFFMLPTSDNRKKTLKEI